MEDVDVPRELASLDCIGGPFDMITASFFLGRQKLLASPDKPGMALWRERLFAGMSRSSESAMEFFKIPTNRVVGGKRVVTGKSVYVRVELGGRRIHKKIQEQRRNYTNYL